MPSLKDLRNRIASVKATQKITKAMQMVAAAKLRRAQEAAVAARPYAERMQAMLAGLASGMEGAAGAPTLLAGNGRDDVHLLVVCTAERGLCGSFNSSIARLAREHANRLIAQGKTVKILCVGRKGADALKRDLGPRIIRTVEMRGVRNIGFAQADMVGKLLLELYAAGEFRCRDAVLCAVQVGHPADPDGAAADPGRRLRRGRAHRRRRDLRIRAGGGGHPRRASAAQHLRAGVPGAPRERRLRAGRPACPPWTARRAMPAR